MAGLKLSVSEEISTDAYVSAGVADEPVDEDLEQYSEDEKNVEDNLHAIPPSSTSSKSNFEAA